MKIDHTYAPKTNKSGVRVCGLMSVEANTAVVTKAGNDFDYLATKVL